MVRSHARLQGQFSLDDPYCTWVGSELMYNSLSDGRGLEERLSSPYPAGAIGGLTQYGISKVLAPSFFADGKSLDES